MLAWFDNLEKTLLWSDQMHTTVVNGNLKYITHLPLACQSSPIQLRRNFRSQVRKMARSSSLARWTGK